MDNNPIYNHDMRDPVYWGNQNYNTAYGYQYNNQYNQQYGYNQGYYNQPYYGGNYYNRGNYGQWNYTAGYYNPGYYKYGNYNQGYQQPYYGHNYYQSLYNMFGVHNPVLEKEFAEVSRRGIITGAVMLAIFVMQIAISTVISLLPVSEVYASDTRFSMGLDVLLQSFYMFLPALLIYNLTKLKKENDWDVRVVYGKPKSIKLFILGISAGLAVCLVGNVATSFFLNILTGFGVTFYSGSQGTEIQTDLLSSLLFVINTAVMPALFEEFTFRGVIMQPLRKYGDWFAIVASAVCFAVVHANMIQIPFAFIAGLSLGYFCIRTKSIWTSVVIHFLNNFYSVIFSIYFEKHPDASSFTYLVISGTIVIIGVVALVVFKNLCTVKLMKDATVMDKNKRLKQAAFIASPTIVVAIFFALFMSISFMKITSYLGLLITFAGLLVTGICFILLIRIINLEKSINQRKIYMVSLIITIVACAFLAIGLLAALVQKV